MQAPGRPDEDTRGGFSHSGWAIPGNDEVMRHALAERMGKPDGGLLFGRRSCEDMLGLLETPGAARTRTRSTPPPSTSPRRTPRRDSTGPTRLSCTETSPPPWPSSKQNSPGDLVIMGSGQLIRWLLPHRLIDEYLLMIHALVLGSGQRVFDHDDHVANLRLLNTIPTTTGVILATYQPS